MRKRKRKKEEEEKRRVASRRNELRELLGTFSVGTNGEKWSGIGKKKTRRGIGKLNFDSFYRVATHFQEEDDEALQKELKEAFRLYDKEGNGYIPTSSLREILAALDDQITPDQMDGMIAEIDTDGSGTVDFDVCTWLRLLKLLVLALRACKHKYSTGHQSPQHCSWKSTNRHMRKDAYYDEAISGGTNLPTYVKTDLLLRDEPSNCMKLKRVTTRPLGNDY
ncbi:hypothetical protein M0802_003931 [Mischocyttarus mexicanus]|nr:hypothetical protein M0802_003931 [Mischocyttarus mexicanus]